MSFYHQSERDEAVSLGCLILLAFFAGGVLLGLLAVLI